MSDTCAREGCSNPLNTGNTYCSRDCANKDRAARQARSESLELTVRSVRQHDLTPLENHLLPVLGHSGTNAILSEIEEQMAISDSGLDGEHGMTLSLWPDQIRGQYPLGTVSTFGISIPMPSLNPPTASQLEPDSLLVPNYTNSGFVSDIRRDGAISFKDIDRLMKLGPYVMGSRLKKGPIMSALSGKRKWKVQCNDAKLKAVIEADLQNVLARNVNNILTAMDYGAAFGSVMWEQRDADYIGVGKGVGRSTEWWVVDKIEWAHPSTVPEIMRDKSTNAFAGYYHVRRKMDPQAVIIDPHQALVVTYGGLFGNMWGQPMGEVIYDFAYWYEVVIRAFLRYLQRMGTPVTVVYGPNRGHSKRPDGTKISNPQYGLLLAGAAALSSGIYLPSEVDLQTGQPLWRMEYLQTDQRGEQFVQAARYFGTQITRGMLVGDRMATQDSESGSYNIGRQHAVATQTDSDFIFKDILWQLDRYLVRRYGMWNRDFNSPPMARLIAEVIDSIEQEVLMKLFATAGNVKIHDGTPLDKVDWEEAFRSIHVPLLTPEEIEEDRKRVMKIKEENMKLAQKVAPKPTPFGGGGGSQDQKQDQKQAQPSRNGGSAQSKLIEYLADGGLLPVLLSPGQVASLKERELEPIILQQTKSGEPVKNPEFESKHSRSADGTFAKKEEEGEGDEEDGEDDRDALDQEPWPGATTWMAPDGTEVAIKGVVTLDGVEYTVVDGVSKEQLLAVHESNMRMRERATDFYGEPLPKSDIFIVPGEEGVAMVDNHPLKSGSPAILMDSGFDSPGEIEHALFHESLHIQPRELRGGATWDNVPMYPEEAFTGILSLAYAEQYNLPLNIGWHTAVSPLVAAAQERGWSKDRLYDFAMSAHKVDGPLYKSAVRSLLRGTNVELKSYFEALDEWWPEWSGWSVTDRSPSSWPDAEYGDW